MHSALWLLTKLRFKAACRQITRGAKTIRGALLLLFALAFVGMMLIPAFVATFSNDMPRLTLIDDYGPVLLLVYTICLLV